MVNGGGARLAMCAGMRVPTSLPAIWRESLRASAAVVRASAKPNETAASGDQAQDSPRDAQRGRRPLRVELVCQDGTRPHDPFWDAPRLNPAFVTQLLGQAMANHERTAPRIVYAGSDRDEALVFDARV
jgi:hypothetical protein